MPPGLNQNEVAVDYPGRQYPSGNMHLTNVSKDQSITFKHLSEVGNISMNRNSIVVLGVTLTDERGVGKTVGIDSNRNVVLGAICIENVKINLEELRRIMCSDIACLPALFCFLSKDGWPIQKQQEHLVQSSHVISERNTICIKKQFEKQRIGVVATGGDPIGFVFVDMSIDIKQLREAIEQQLKSQQLKAEYRFLERNGWPITSSQETLFSLIDIMLGHVVCIQNGERTEPVRPTSVSFGNNTTAIENRTPTSQEASEGEPVRRKKSSKFIKSDTQSSVKGGKASEKRVRRGKEDLVKPILISYVRAEAAQYALDLKRELVRMGFSVYLDVHEIKTGSDWQDALNFAVTHCFVFVPLITPMYGKTQWTNREIKLADVLGKMIIPINFMDNWPPACLAIQFASTQYIPWKFLENDHVKVELEKSSDPRLWDPVYVKRVAKQIAESYKENYYKWPLRHPSNGKDLVEQQINRPLLSAKEDYSMLRKEDVFEEKKSIVISAHPRQRYVAQELKALFEKEGHDVWCSINIQEVQESLNSEEKNGSNPNTPRELPTIAEGEVFFSQNEMEMLSSLGEKRSISMYKEPEGYGRRPLSRLMSQFSDISQPSTLSPEKLERLRTFQQKVDQAGVVIVLISEDYTKSTFSHQQVFYCEHRKRVVQVKCDSAQIPKWFRLLMGNDVVMKVNNPQFECMLKARVTRSLNPTSKETPRDASTEAKINYLVNFLKRNLNLQDMCVYIAGSSKLQTPRAEEICRAIGRELAKVGKVSLVTGGFFGAADITAKTFCDSKENSCNLNADDSAVVHILPMHDPEDLKSKARQNLDGSFEAIPYGKTVFLGDNVKERETVVARLLDTCIVIEGGPGVVHEVEEFIWNDHFVIPIISTGGAAGGKYGVPMKIFELPPGVEMEDWSVLEDADATPEAVAKAVVNIMISLKKAVSSPTSTLKSNVITKRKSRKKSKSKKSKTWEVDESPSNRSTTDSVLSGQSVFEISEPPTLSHYNIRERNGVVKKRNWLQRVLKVFKPKN